MGAQPLSLKHTLLSLLKSVHALIYKSKLPHILSLYSPFDYFFFIHSSPYSSLYIINYFPSHSVSSEIIIMLFSTFSNMVMIMNEIELSFFPTYKQMYYFYQIAGSSATTHCNCMQFRSIILNSLFIQYIPHT